MIFMFFLGGQVQGLSISVASDPSTVQYSYAQLQVYGTISAALPAGGTLVLTAPSNLAVFSGSLACSFVSSGSLTATCTASGKSITIRFSQAVTAGTGFQLNINSCIGNPQTTNPSSTFTAVTYSGSTIVEQQATGITLTATAGAIGSLTLSTDSQVVGASSTLTLTVNIARTIPAGGILVFGFPIWNPNAPTAQQVQYFTSTPTCTGVSFLSNPLSCSFSSGTLTVSNGVFTNIAGGSTLALQVAGFTNPISAESISGFSVTTQDSSAGSIDTGTGTLQITTAGTFTGGTVTGSASSTGQVQDTNDIQIQMSSPVPFDTGCNIEVIVPSELTMTGVSTVTVFGMFGVYNTITPTINQATRTITFSSCTSYASNTQVAQITINGLVNPYYVKTTSSFSVTITTSSNAAIATITSGLTFTPSVGAITLSSSSAASQTVSATTTITLGLLHSHSLIQSATQATQMLMTFPSEYVLATTCSTTAISNFAASPTCTVSGQLVTLDNFVSTSFTGGSIMSFSIGQITLPSTTTQPSGLEVKTYVQDTTDNNLYAVDEGTFALSFAISFGSITATVTPASTVASITTSYTISFTPEHQIPQNGYIYITYPSDITISDTQYSQSTTSGYTGFPSTPSLIITSTQIQILSGFRSASLAAAGTTFSLVIPGITNPATTATTGAFYFSTYDSAGNEIDKSGSSTTVTMTSNSDLNSVYLYLGTYNASAKTNYTFSITSSLQLTESNYLIFIFPEQITIPDDSTNIPCYSNQTSLIYSVTCSYSSRATNAIMAYYKLAYDVSVINAQQTFNITIGDIVNPASTNRTDTFQVNITDSNFNTINSNPNLLYVTMTTPNEVDTAYLVQNTTTPSQFIFISIIFYPMNYIMKGGGIQITWPSQIAIFGSLSVRLYETSTSSYGRTYGNLVEEEPTVNYNINTRQITLTNVFESLYIPGDNAFLNITMTGFKNPSSNVYSDSFKVVTFNVSSFSQSTYYYIDQAALNLTLNSSCDFPCKSCVPGFPSNCTSCFEDSDLDKLQYGTCVSGCNMGSFFNASNGTCQPCSPDCQQCAFNESYCIACGGNTEYQFLIDGKCYKKCPNGSIEDPQNNLCKACEPPCLTCVNTTQTCTSCNTSSRFPLYFDQMHTCHNRCPANITARRGKYCYPCDRSCKTCDRRGTDICTSCENYMKFDRFENTCTQFCEEGIEIYNPRSQFCNPCSDNCKTCAQDVNTCTSCPSDLVLNMDSTCATSCNNKNQSQVAIDSICRDCQLPCSECRDTPDHCTKCSGDFYLYNTTCVQYCPLKFEVNNDTNQCILIGLVCPEDYVVNEAGDGCIPRKIECKDGYMVNSQKNACIPEPGFPVPFPFIFFSICICLLVLGSYIRDKSVTRIFTCLIALVGVQEILIYLLMIGYCIQLTEYDILVIVLVAFFMLLTSNFSFFIYFKKDIVKDPTFLKWTKIYPRTSKWLPVLSIIVNFKLLKMLYSGFYSHEAFMAQFEDPIKNFLRPLKLVTIFSFVFVYIPILVADLMIFSRIQWGYQLLILAIESLILALFIVILTFIEFRNPQALFYSANDQYVKIKNKSFVNVSSGIQDLDESTLIRKKESMDDKEILLRKKALVTILDFVGKNFMQAKTKGQDIGGQLDLCRNQFYVEKQAEKIKQQEIKFAPKLRRCFSDIKEEEKEWSDDDTQNFENQAELYNKQKQMEEDERENRLQRRHSFPMDNNMETVVVSQEFVHTLQEMKGFTKENQNQDNCYADVKPPDKEKDKKRRKTVSRRTQTYLRELLSFQGEDLVESDLEIVMEDDAEMDGDYAKSLIGNVIDGLSESESNYGGKKKLKKKKRLGKKRELEIPDFELADIMGDFEIDDLGNFIILRGEKGELLDKKERRVNRRGYLIDRFGNIMNNKGQVIFKAVELDSDDEIPAPFGFEKRKKQLLNMGEDGEFKVKEGQMTKEQMDNDEEMVEKELKQMKHSNRRKKKKIIRKINDDGVEVVEEVDDEDYESSVDTRMGDSPGKYQLGGEFDDDEIIDRVTKKKIPRKKPGQKGDLSPSGRKKTSPGRGGNNIMSNNQGLESNRSNKKSKLPPKRIKKEDTKEIFPSKTIDTNEQKRLMKIAESIGQFASQVADKEQKQQQFDIQSATSLIPNTKQEQLKQEQLKQEQIKQEQLDKIKQEHFKDILQNVQAPQDNISFVNNGMRILGEAQNQKRKKRPPKDQYSSKYPVEKVYGNLNDVVNYEEKQILDQLRDKNNMSAFSSQMTQRVGHSQRPETTQIGDNRRMRGLETIYLQKFDKNKGGNNSQSRKPDRAKFRQTINQFVDDPELLVEDNGFDFSNQNEISMQVAEKLDKLQKQYMTSNATNKVPFHQNGSQNVQTSLGMHQTVDGLSPGKKRGSFSGTLNQDNSIDPIKKGNWMAKQQ